MTFQMITRSLVVSALAAATLALAGCGGSDSSNHASTPDTAAATVQATATTAAADDCGGNVVDTVKKAVTSDAVQKIQVIGGCHMVSIETSLGPDAKADGQKICDAAAKVAYNDQISSVSVDGADGHELAAGIKGMPCL